MARWRALFPALVAAALITPLAPSGPDRAAAAESVTVRIDTTLRPSTVTVTVGATVTWRNEDGERHRVRSVSGPEKVDSGNLEPGERWSHTFERGGTYRYVDHRNEEDRGYWGEVVVRPRPGSGGGGAGGGGAGGGGAGGGGAGGGSAPATASVTVGDRSFSPTAVTVAVGGTVTWVNRGGREHTVTASDRSFDSGVLGGGGRFSYRFSRPGTYGYLCLIHPDMIGTARVVGPGDPGGSPVPATSGSSGGPSAQPSGHGGGRTAGGARTVEVRDFAFAPREISVPAGEKVTWRVVGQAPHTVTAAGGEFDSGMLQPGERFSHAFRTVGTISYVCSFHPEMTGVVRVVDGDEREGAIAPAPSSARPTPIPRTAGTPVAGRAATEREPPWGRAAGGIAAGLALGAAAAGILGVARLRGRRRRDGAGPTS